MLVATAISVLLLVVSVNDWPPAGWIIDLNDKIKSTWVTSPDLEPPFGHAEAVSLAALATRMQFDLSSMLRALDDAGIPVADERDSLNSIARASGMTPMAVYAVIRPQRPQAAKGFSSLSMAEIEARLAGSGLGRKSVAARGIVSPAATVECGCAAPAFAAGHGPFHSAAERRGD